MSLIKKSFTSELNILPVILFMIIMSTGILPGMPPVNALDKSPGTGIHAPGMLEEDTLPGFAAPLQHLNSKTDVDLLDSVVVYDYASETDSTRRRKDVFIHDVTKNETTTHYLWWDKTESKWIKNGKIIQAETHDGKVLYSKHFHWDAIEQEWKDGLWYWSGHHQNKYDKAGRIIESITYLQHDNMEGSIQQKNTWEYDREGRKVFTRQYTRTHDEGSELKLSLEHQTIYDDENLKRYKTTRVFSNESGELQNYSKRIFQLNASGNVLDNEYLEWSKEKNEWIKQEKTSREYNTSNEVTEIINKEWDVNNKQWNNRKKLQFTYNHLGINVITDEYMWIANMGWYLRESFKILKEKIDSSGFDEVETSYVKEDPYSDYLPFIRNYRQFDAKDRETRLENFMWNETENKWEYGRKHVTNFNDEENVRITLNYRDVNKSEWELSWKDIKKYNEEDLILYSKQQYHEAVTERAGNGTFYYYSNLTPSATSVNEKGIQLTLYPNPSTGIVYLKGIEDVHAEVKVYNVAGKLMHETRAFGVKKINLSGLKEGMYFIRVSNGSKVNTETIMLK